MTPELKVMTTFYSRGAVVKLAEDHSAQAVAKFVVEVRRGEVRLMVAARDARGKPWLRERPHAGTLESAVAAAERECECIRIGRGDGGSGVG